MTQLNLTHYLSLLEISGPDAENFLQSQFTNDVTALKTQAWQWQSYCNRQGLVQNVFGLFLSNEKYYLLSNQSLLSNTLTLLKKYGQFVKVQFREMNNINIQLNLINSAEKNVNWQVEKLDDTSLQLNWLSVFQTLSLSDELSLRLHFIQHGFPWLQTTTSDLFRPHDLSLPQLKIVNFKKGCYPGQEIIARMEYRGKPKYHLATFVSDIHLALTPGATIPDKGWVVDVVEYQQQQFVSAALL